ncbi:hypothetical protein Tco_1291689 [Tanacetum coccineum]
MKLITSKDITEYITTKIPKICTPLLTITETVTILDISHKTECPIHHDISEKPETSTEEMMREWMARQTEANERIKNHVVELERQINQGLRNRQAIIQNLKRQFEFLEEEGNVEFIEEDETQLIPTMPKPSLSNSNSTIVSPFLKDCTVNIPYRNAKTFADDVLTNHVGDKELSSMDGVGTGRLTKKEIKKDDNDVPKEPKKDWKLDEKVVPHNENVYHYQCHPIEIPHLNRIIKES